MWPGRDPATLGYRPAPVPKPAAPGNYRENKQTAPAACTVLNHGELWRPSLSAVALGRTPAQKGRDTGVGARLGSTCRGSATRRGCVGRWPRPERCSPLAVTQPSGLSHPSQTPGQLRPSCRLQVLPPSHGEPPCPAPSACVQPTGRALSALQEGPRAGSGRPVSRGAAPRPHTATSQLAHTGLSTAGGDLEGPGYRAGEARSPLATPGGRSRAQLAMDWNVSPAGRHLVSICPAQLGPNIKGSPAPATSSALAARREGTRTALLPPRPSTAPGSSQSSTPTWAPPAQPTAAASVTGLHAN